MNGAKVFKNRPVKEQRLFFLLSILLSFAIISQDVYAGNNSAAEHIKEIAPGLLEGYLAPEMLPNSLKLLPPPPAAESAAFALDKDVSEQNIKLQNSPRWQQAVADANLHFPEAIESFVDIAKIPINEKEAPYLYLLLRRTLTDFGLSTYAAKTEYNRIRPFMMNDKPLCTPEDEKGLRKDGSYPSGHTAVGWGWALLLSELFPEKTDEILKRGWDFGQSRVVCNVHWQSDVSQGRIMGAATFARLHADPQFLRDLEAAKSEIELLRESKQP